VAQSAAQSGTARDGERGSSGLDEARRVLRELRHRITTGVLAPGMQLTEHALASTLEVSRARIRDAIGQLETAGLVERVANRGAFVRRMTIEELRAVFEAREALEGMCARRAAERVAAAPANAAAWQDFALLFGEPIEALIAAGDLEAYIDQVSLLRRRIILASGNREIARILSQLLDRSAVSMRRVVLATTRASEALMQHRLVLAALVAGDGAEAERLKRAQVHAAWKALERYHRLVL
jgi:DNA-binding GntR family transcriptional regulator